MMKKKKQIKKYMMNKSIFISMILIIIAIAASSNLQAQKDKRYIRAGNKLYENQKFDEAELNYRKAIEVNDNNIKADFNLADALYKKESYSEAAGKFEYLASKTKDPKLIGDISYNLGNSYFMQAKAASESGDQQQMQSSMTHLKNALGAYKKALMQNPKDNDARYNYELTRQLLQQQQQQQQQNKDKNKDGQDKDDQNKDKQDQNKDGQDKDDQNKDGQNKDDQNKDGKNKDDQNKDKQDQQNKDGQNKDDQNKDKQDQQQPQKGKEQKMSKEDAEQMLKALQQKEKATMKKMKQQKGSKVKIEKNW